MRQTKYIHVFVLCKDLKVGRVSIKYSIIVGISTCRHGQKTYMVEYYLTKNSMAIPKNG